MRITRERRACWSRPPVTSPTKRLSPPRVKTSEQRINARAITEPHNNKSKARWNRFRCCCCQREQESEHASFLSVENEPAVTLIADQRNGERPSTMAAYSLVKLNSVCRGRHCESQSFLRGLSWLIWILLHLEHLLCLCLCQHAVEKPTIFG